MGPPGARHKALGAADVFSRRQSPGQCPTYRSGFPDWALPSAVRAWGQNSEPGPGSSSASLPGERNLVSAIPSLPKASPTAPRQMLLGSEKKGTRGTHPAAQPQTGLCARGLERHPKAGLVQAPSSDAAFWPSGLQPGTAASVSERKFLGEAEGNLVSSCSCPGW